MLVIDEKYLLLSKLQHPPPPSPTMSIKLKQVNRMIQMTGHFLKTTQYSK